MVSTNTRSVQAATYSLHVDLVGSWPCSDATFLHSQLHHQVKYHSLYRPLGHGHFGPGILHTSISFTVSEMYGVSVLTSAVQAMSPACNSKFAR